jgi:hypothetical protein
MHSLPFIFVPYDLIILVIFATITLRVYRIHSIDSLLRIPGDG